jgi:hypothetical protein
MSGGRGPLRIDHTLTDTPLAREHERLLRRRERPVPVEIPWRRFDRSKFPEPALALALDLQRSLVAGEYLAVESFSRVVVALTTVGAPLDLVAAATRVPPDEIRHADYTLRMAALLAGRPLAELAVEVSAAEVAARDEAYAGRPSSLEDLDLWMVDVTAFGETLACALLLACARRAREPVSKALFRTLVADEVRHARLGWYYLLWRARRWTPAERRRAGHRAAASVHGALARFGRGRDAPRGSTAAARALGVLDTPSQRAAVIEVVQREIVPGFDALGLGTGPAWRGRVGAKS